MFVKFVISSLALVCLARADVKHLPRSYLPPSSQEGAEKSSLVSTIVQDVPHLPGTEIDENRLVLQNSDTLTKEASRDPIYGNSPFNGLPGGFTGPLYNQAFAGQGFPGQFYPGVPPQGFPGPIVPGAVLPPSAGFVNPGIPPQGFANPILPGQGFPASGFPGQAFPGQGFPGQGFSGQGFPINPGFPIQAYPNYPIYYSPIGQTETAANNDIDDNTLRIRVRHTATQYDDANGGYLYNKPNLKF